MFSEVVSTFCGKRLFGYTSMVYATVVITILSYLVWLHHFFTMGSGASVNSFFGITTMIISIPTGAKIFNWLFTMYRGRIRFEVPMLWTVGFMVTFVIGGMTGVLLAVPPADFVLHNSLFLIAHFHNVIIGGVVFGMFAGHHLLVPEGVRLQARAVLGQAVVLVLVHRLLLRLHAALCARADGRDPPAQPFRRSVAADLVRHRGVRRLPDRCSASCSFVIQLVVSFLKREQLRDLTGDPWHGRTLEWSTSSPPPVYNFAFTPMIHDGDAWWDMKQRGYARPLEGFKPIHMPKNTGAGIVPRRVLQRVCGFGLIWHIWWLAAVGFVALIVTAIGHTFNYERDFYIPAEQVVRTEERAEPICSRPRFKPMSVHAAEAVERQEELRFYLDEEHGHAEGGTMLGFWIYLMSDCLVFAVLFATYGVLGRKLCRRPVASRSVRSAAGRAQHDHAAVLLHHVWLRHAGRWKRTRCGRRSCWLAVTGLFGPAFLGLELNEFAALHRGGRDAAAQRVPVRVLHAGRDARAARDVRHHLARDADGPGRRSAASSRRTGAA